MMDCRILERNFQAIAATEIGPRLIDAFATELRTYLGADGCYIVEQRDAWTATCLFGWPALDHNLPFNPDQLVELTSSGPFFFEPAFVPRRALKSMLGSYGQVAGLRIDNYSFKAWVLIGWQTPTNHDPWEIENALYRFGDKVLINYLSLRRIAIEQQYRFLFSVVPQAVVLVNEADETSWVNQAAIELLGLEPDVLRPLSADLSVAMNALRKRALNQDAINTVATQLLTDPKFSVNEWLWTFDNQALSVLTRPIHSPYFRGRIWLFNDVTKTYQANQQLTEAYRDIENLVGVIAHDLKSPLATLHFIFNFLPMHGPLNEEQQENVNYGLKTIKRGLGLIDSIVYFNKLITSQQPVAMNDIELDDLLDVVVDGFSAQAQRKNITLYVSKPGRPVILHTDPESLVRILDNLISNALKFSPFDRNVYIATNLRNGQLSIAVRDEGPGIPPEERGKLFKRFQRLSAQPTNNEDSSGLGLSIVKALTDKLGASIEVDSTVSIGTTFRLVFPAHYVRLDEAEALSAHSV